MTPPHDRPHDPQYPVDARRQRVHEIVFEAESPAGRAFDIVLLVAIVASVVTVLYESVPSVRVRFFRELYVLEWFFTLLFTVEYIVRLYAVQRPLRYARSFYGVVDLLAILPTYLSLLLPGAQALSVVRGLRLLRVFRILKLSAYLNESGQLWRALLASRRKITIFLFTVLTIVVIAGAAMHLVEGSASGFTDIPTSVYWAIVTITTVGYGDVAPVTALGRLLATMLMLLGYGIIAVPTGIVTAELTRELRQEVTNNACPSCGAEGHGADAIFCRRCGARL
jgi:voltage-gated potassium channel